VEAIPSESKFLHNQLAEKANVLNNQARIRIIENFPLFITVFFFSRKITSINVSRMLRIIVFLPIEPLSFKYFFSLPHLEREYRDTFWHP
jgi:hypothetical protein